MTGRVLHQRILLLGLHGVALGILALQGFVRSFPPTPTAIPEPGSPENLWWGLWPITYLPGWVYSVGAGTVILLIVYAWWRELTHREPSSLGRGRTSALRYPLVTISALLIVAFFTFPIVHTRWGDAYILSKSIAWPDPALRLTRSWQAPLDVALHSSVWLALQPYFAWEDATPVYQILSPLAGGVYLVALLRISRDPRIAPSWLSCGLIVTLGVLQLFFGYVENYSFAAAFVLVYMWLGIEVAQQRRSLWIAATVLALTHAFHPSTIVLGPSLLYLAWLQLHREDGTPPAGNKVDANDVIHIGVQLIAPFVLVYGFTWIMMEAGNHGLAALFSSDRPGGGDGRWLVPLRATTTEWEHYTLLSWPHLRDVLNEQQLIAPVVLPSLIVVGLLRLITRHDATTDDVRSRLPDYVKPDRPLIRFLSIAFAFYLIFTLMWNPDYGGQRDWDLFSLVAIPETLLLIYLLTRTVSPIRYLAMGAAPLIAVQALHTGAWIYQNTLPWSWP
jgi:hypothetical protein